MMYTKQPKKLTIMNILDILKRYTDENHRLSQKEIQEILEREYEINPYQLVAKEGKYYLICNNVKYDSVSNYRVDRMTDMEILPHKRRAFNTLIGSDGNQLDLNAYMESISICSRERISAPCSEPKCSSSATSSTCSARM